ncbi:hypothetical protein [Pseudomonas sp. Xaverov 259]|uniref:hypothetical protein n=1 Tax=Pseudomonas sp. Xaverov 259 TaxID=2666086 RepID=UPI001C5BCD19|nr:hypothetical protein [Pseudomonas sp. Xaverov 259]
MIGKQITVKAIPITPGAFPPDIQGVDPVTRYIPASEADKPIVLTITSGAGSDAGDWVRIYRRDVINDFPDAWTLVAEKQFVINAPGDTFTVDIPVVTSSGKQLSGDFQVRSELFQNIGADPSIPGDVDRPGSLGQSSPFSTYKMDLDPPYLSRQPPAPIYTGTFPPGQVISLAQLTQFNLPFSIPDNTTTGLGAWKPGDTLTIFYNHGTPATATEVASQTPPRPMTQTGNTVTVLASEITQGGPCFFTYQIADAQGNTSLVSAPSMPFTIALDPAPDNLLPIIIHQAPDLVDDLVTIEDLKTGPTGVIPAYTNVDLTKDEYRVRYNNGAWSQWIRVASVPITLDQALLNPLAIADYGTTKGPKTVVINYEIRKNGDTFPGPITQFRVDFSVTGPGNPGIPGSINTRLVPASFRGTGAAVDNELAFAQAGLPVKVTIELWQTTDPLEMPGPGMFLILVNPDGTFIAPSKELTTELPGQPVSWDIDWSVFQQLGNGIHNLSYVVSPTATPTAATNLNRAAPTPVKVLDAVTTPLPAARYIGATTGTFGQWACQALTAAPPINWEGRITVPGDSRMVEGQLLTLVLQVFRPRTGTPRLFDQTQSYNVTISSAIKTNGYTFQIPYAGFLEHAQLGRAELTYTAPLNNGTLGRGTAGVNVRTTLSYTRCDNVGAIIVP